MNCFGFSSDRILVNKICAIITFSALFVSYASGQCSVPGTAITVQGIAMDNFCINRGTLLDKPSIRTLEKPYEHTIHCLIDIPQCVESEYTLLLAPKSSGDLWTVGYQLGKEGTDMIIAEAKKLRAQGLLQNLTLTLSGVVESNGNKEPFLRCIQIIQSNGSASSGASVDVQFFRAIHGSLMFLAWIVLTPLGVLIARYYKHLGHRWYTYHVGIQMTVLLLTIASAMVIFFSLSPSTTFDDTSNRAAFAHASIGLFVIVGAACQSMLGKYADYLYQKESGRLGTPVFPDKIHWWLGRLLAVLAVINVWIGVDIFSSGKGWWIGIGAVILVIYTVLYAVNEGRRRASGPNDQFVEMAHRQ